MILLLSVRFRKYVALFLYSVFYSQLLLAATQERMTHTPLDLRRTRKNVGGVHLPASLHSDMPLRLISPDSTVLPAHNRQMPDFTVSPSFRMPATPLSGKGIRPGALADADQQDAPAVGGPNQPETQTFQSVNGNNMVDLFSGDFSYNIPLLDVGGYPVNIAYHSGRTMDEDASWVGLGWNINPGSITRDMRGVPDDFSGGSDTVTKIASMKPNLNVGVSGGADFEVAGLPSLTLSPSAGVFFTTYNGWGLEAGVNASLRAGLKSAGNLTGGLGLSDNSQNGLTLTPSLSYAYEKTNKEAIGYGGDLSMSAPYNSRSGLKDLQLGLNYSLTRSSSDTKKNTSASWPVAGITFAWPTYTPTINIPMTNKNYTFTAKWGGEATVAHPSFFVSGYGGEEYVAPADTALALPTFGYLNFQNRSGGYTALMDFNREKEIPYREDPPVPHIAVPSYTYDVFTIMGEGSGGMFRAYRGDIGFVSDHLIANKTTTAAASIDLGSGNMVHQGIDLNANYSTTTTGPWISENPLLNTINFQSSNGLYEAAYFRNPGEKAINTTAFYKAIGGENVAVAGLVQNGSSIMTNNVLNLFNGGKQVGSDTLNPGNAIRTTRDKRSQVISYLTAAEASVSGLDKYIKRYDVNQFGHYCGNDAASDSLVKGTGLMGYYFTNMELNGLPYQPRLDSQVFFNWKYGEPFYNKNGDAGETQVVTGIPFPQTHYSIRWVGRLKAPVSGPFRFGFFADDGVRMWLDDTLEINDWHIHSLTWDTTKNINLVAGKFYNIRIEYFQDLNWTACQFAWKRPDNNDRFDKNNKDTVLEKYLYPPAFTDTNYVNPILTQENRVNGFRKANHISEIDVLNADGRRYVYGIPVYNLQQKEVSFAVNSDSGNIQTGLTGYVANDISTHNNEGKDGFYSQEDIPAYAHSFLLTGILSPDYVDVTGDGISDDDIGDAVRFDYSKTSGIANPYGWRAPYVTNKASYNEGFRSYNRDDKGNYIYGTKELWYLHTIETKTMIATFTLQPRADLIGVDENGKKFDSTKAMCLKQIDLYSKADFLKNGTAAVPVKTVHFVYSYELCRGINAPLNDSGKLTLKEIWFTYNGNNKGVLNPYVFNYHPNNPNYQVNMSDKWGTYKDPAKNPDATPTNPITNEEYPYSLQDSATAAYNAGAWMLDSITLPAGGRIKVNYESDDYAYTQNRRAAQMCNIAGIGLDASGNYSNQLYNFLLLNDGLYIYMRVPVAPASNADLYARYLDGIKQFFFRLNVMMPKDDWGSGSEYIPCYAYADTSLTNWYGISPRDPNTIWVKLKGVNSSATGDGNYSPLAQTAINFLRLNLPDKAYPGSETGDNPTLQDRVMIALSLLTNISSMITGFSSTARGNGWARTIDTSRSFARLDCPSFKKYGGGARVKSVLIYDNWNAMTGNRETVYGQTYNYTTTQNVNGVPTTISSGVAAWEPATGGEENPFHQAIEYTEKSSIIGPASEQYSVEPLGESFYPGPSVGYSRVTTRSIHTTGTRSANGWSESTFYTAYDFPTSWDWSNLDNNTKKRYKPALLNFLRINVQNYLTLSQGFKVELNDMNGKPRSEATYSETDSTHPINSTQYFYKVKNQSVGSKQLCNTVAAIDPQGNIDTAATIGEDAELMTDMREQTTAITGANINLNSDMFVAGPWPVIIPTLLDLYQHETDRYRSVALMKVVQHYGILDSVVHIDRGSKVYTKNLLYDAETGDALLTRTQNEFNDSIFQFSYPAHWAYSAMAPAYQNIDAILYHLKVRNGMVDPSTAPGPIANYLTPGDELLVNSKQTITNYTCDSAMVASFPDSFRLWVVDTSIINGGSTGLFLVDQYGTPFSGNDVTLKVLRSGHRNQSSAIGSVTSLANPLVADAQGVYHLVLDTTRQVVSASANELQQLWRVADKRRSNILTSCVSTQQDSSLAAAEACNCLQPFFSYLIAHHGLYPWHPPYPTVGAIAAAAGITLSSCPILSNNANDAFQVLTPDPNGNIYMVRLGSDYFQIRSVSGLPMNLYSLTNVTCNAAGQVTFKNPGLTVPPPDTITLNLYPTFTVNLEAPLTVCPYTDSAQIMDSVTDHLMVENGYTIPNGERNTFPVLGFGRLDLRLPPFLSNVLSAKLILTADQRGHNPPAVTTANSTRPKDSVGVSLIQSAGWFPWLPLDTLLNEAYYSPWYKAVANDTTFQSVNLDMTDYVNGFLSGVYPSTNFMLTQGSGPLHSNIVDSAQLATDGLLPYLATGYGNYYSTYYSQRYSDSTKWPVLQVKYVAQAFVDTFGAVLQYNSTASCNTIYGRSCYSSVTDTLVNPYEYALLGNYRPLKSYVYYGRRVETDPLQPTNIRKNGVISNFAPFWTLQNGQWAPNYDSTRWVWNSQTTLYNIKGFEIENKDPLGRYNAGIYGYNSTLPVAVIQNSHYQESAFEGFEDYGFTTNSCDTTCAVSRPFDFSAYSSNISDSAAHTGLYSLRVPQGSSINLVGLPVAASPDAPNPQFSDTLNTDSCGQHFDGFKASSNSVLPSFKPFAGKQMLVGAWVKEEDSCSCQTYSNDHLVVNFSLAGGGDSTVTLQPSGNMIEGWQRYEAIIHIPLTATSLSLVLQASASSTTYFDDIRIHPFNAEMKSYIYNSTNLRLMSELDENNYATFYEYDDDGTLIRVKKETERGIETIKETRNALLKHQ